MLMIFKFPINKNFSKNCIAFLEDVVDSSAWLGSWIAPKLNAHCDFDFVENKSNIS